MSTESFFIEHVCAEEATHHSCVLTMRVRDLAGAEERMRKLGVIRVGPFVRGQRASEVDCYAWLPKNVPSTLLAYETWLTQLTVL